MTTTINNLTYTVHPGAPMPSLTLYGYDGVVYWLRRAGERARKAYKRAGEFVIVY